MENLISAKACVWDVSMADLRGSSEITSPGKLLRHQKRETKGTPPPTKTKSVDLNGHVTVFVLGKKNEYYASNGQTLTSLIMGSAICKGNKLKLY